MGSIGDTFGLTVPLVGAAGPTYASTINSILTEAMTRLETRVPSGSLAAWTGAVDANNNRLDNVSGLVLYEQSSAPSGTPYGRMVRYNGNLYYVDSSGAVQITSGSGLNASAIGGIVGDYGGADPAKVSFVGGTETYEFYDDMSLSEWAIIKCRGVDIIDEGGNAVGLRPHATTDAWTLTLPQTNGVSADHSVMVCKAGASDWAENITAVTNFTVNAQELKHTNRTVWYPGGGVSSTAGETVWLKQAGDNIATITAANGALYARTLAATATETISRMLPMPPVGQRLKQVDCRVTNTTGATCTVTVYRVTDGTETSLGTANSNTNGTQTISVSLTHTVVANQELLVKIEWTTATGLEIAAFGVGITWDYV